MAIPQKKLILRDFDVEELTLAQSNALYASESYNVADFTDFLMEYVDHENSWTIPEIRAIRRKELDEVRRQLFEFLREQAIPKA